MLETHQLTNGQPKSFEYSNQEPGVTLICVYIELLGGFLVKSFFFQITRPLVAFNMFKPLGPRPFFLKKKICWNDDIPEFHHHLTLLRIEISRKMTCVEFT